MTTKDRLRIVIDQLPKEQVALLEKMLKGVLNDGRPKPPTGKLGLKKNFDRKHLYDELLADRY
ncbi:MAG: hypothetical protein ONB44_12410 [candidate division KSB1 bacterium]|nr:hypothetical protein [candidate division KSB1 bacterium]MDZ7302924.1 hypothetical protein [candidate division KSB1 bacterium]MDZ7310499.1 hypothetical protein [candidate division KSB1 bacterium]